MPEQLTLSDGTVFEFSNAILSGDLFLYIRGKTLKAVFDQLIKPKKVEQITYTQVNGVDIVFSGFQKLIAVRDEGNNLVTAVLRREVNN